jgi:hypothetical protein
MTTGKRFKAMAAGVAAALVVAALVALPVVAYESQVAMTERPAGRQFYEQPPLVMPAAAFSEAKEPADPFYFNYAGGYMRGGYACVTGPVYLPRGARVREVYASLYDNDAGGGARVYVYRVDNFLGTTTEMAYLGSTGSSSTIQVVSDQTINAPDVQYPGYAYYAHVCLDSSNTRLYSVRIYYDVRVYLPAIVKMP